jgi:hypothetical protein
MKTLNTLESEKIIGGDDGDGCETSAAIFLPGAFGAAALALGVGIILHVINDWNNFKAGFAEGLAYYDCE